MRMANTIPASSAKHLRIRVRGCGVIGLSIALELHARGFAVALSGIAQAAHSATRSGAGMLAVDDPANPAALHRLAVYSRALYPQYLDRLETLSGLRVPLQTNRTIEHRDDGSQHELNEASIDPRMLHDALLAAANRCGIEHADHRTEAELTIIATGAWSAQSSHAAVSPAKGQMLRVALPPALATLDSVHRSRKVYIVPRTHGPQTGTALIGATVEDAGFDTTTHAADLQRLRAFAAQLLPALADDRQAPQLEAWAGLRPRTPDDLPLLGATADAHTLMATGHFRNGILLAPATAQIIADLCQGKRPGVDIGTFSPERFAFALRRLPNECDDTATAHLL
jgi:glycine oxidase